MIKKILAFMPRALVVLVLGMVILLFFFHSGDFIISKKIQGNYEMSIFSIDNTFICATVHRRNEAEDGRESVRRIGCHGSFIYWETYSDTFYRINTESDTQERIHSIPAGVVMLDALTFWNELAKKPS